MFDSDPLSEKGKPVGARIFRELSSPAAARGLELDLPKASRLAVPLLLAAHILLGAVYVFVPISREIEVPAHIENHTPGPVRQFDAEIETNVSIDELPPYKAAIRFPNGAERDAEILEVERSREGNLRTVTIALNEDANAAMGTPLTIRFHTLAPALVANDRHLRRK